LEEDAEGFDFGRGEGHLNIIKRDVINNGWLMDVHIDKDWICYLAWDIFSWDNSMKLLYEFGVFD
jgi:hypothetical protein